MQKYKNVNQKFVKLYLKVEKIKHKMCEQGINSDRNISNQKLKSLNYSLNKFSSDMLRTDNSSILYKYAP